MAVKDNRWSLITVMLCAVTLLSSIRIEPEGANVRMQALNLQEPVNAVDEETVHLFSGEFVLEETDLRIRGRGFDFDWWRK